MAVECYLSRKKLSLIHFALVSLLYIHEGCSFLIIATTVWKRCVSHLPDCYAIVSDDLGEGVGPSDEALPSRIVRRPRRRTISESTTTRNSSNATVDSINPHTQALQDPTLLSEQKFRDLELHPSLQRAVSQDYHFQQMTRIQEQTWTPIREGQSVLASARTGTGKTIAFLLPALQRLLEFADNPSPVMDFRPGRSVGLLILVPTRELAQQCANQARLLCTYIGKGWTVHCMVGGTSMGRDVIPWMHGTKQPPVVLVATPGRLWDHMEKTRIRGKSFGETVLSEIPIVVLDETDQLVTNFGKETRKCLSYLSRKRQCLFFSATLPKRCETSLREFLPENTVTITDANESKDSPKMRGNTLVNEYYLVMECIEDYVLLFERLLQQAQGKHDKMVFFFPTTKLVRYMASYCTDVLRVPVLEIHSRMSQGSRSRISATFRTCREGILLTSDVTARGLDYPKVTLVVQYGAPLSEEWYGHRLGRTGRAGQLGGTGIQVILPNESHFRRWLERRGRVRPLCSESAWNIRNDSAGHESLTCTTWMAKRENVAKAQAAYVSFAVYQGEYAKRHHCSVSKGSGRNLIEGLGKALGLSPSLIPPLPVDLFEKE